MISKKDGNKGKQVNQKTSDFMKKHLSWISFPVADMMDRRKYKNAEKRFRPEKIAWIKGCAKKERCFIVATGPSLTLDDINMLTEEDTFGVNSVFKLFDKTPWRPTYYCLSDKVVYESLREGLMEWQPDHVFYSLKEFECDLDHAIPVLCRAAYPLYPYSRMKIRNEKVFSEDAVKCVYTSATVVYFALQIAVTMGYREIYLLGTDCNYTGTQQHNNLVSYGVKAAANAGQAMFLPYEQAKIYADSHDIKIYNATRGGMLDVFPRVKLEEVLEVRS